jgi:hypothetical protein
VKLSAKKPAHPKPAKADDSYRLRLPSASSLSRAIRCQASTIVPGVREPSTYAQERGTLIHSFCEVGITKGRGPAMDWLDAQPNATEEQKELCGKIDLAGLPDGVEVEVAFSYDERRHNATRLVMASHRDYPADKLYHGTTDLCGMVDDETVYVGDIKSGDHEPAKDSWQLRFAALAAAAWTGAKKARVEMLRLWPSGKWGRDAHDLTAEDLRDARNALLALSEHMRTATPLEPGSFEIGPHCKYCPALRVCPAQTAMVRAVEPTLATYAGTEGLPVLSGFDVVHVFQRVQRYEDALKAVRTQIETLVEANGGNIVGEDGRHLVLQCSERRTVDDGAASVLVEEFGAECYPALSVSIGKLRPVMTNRLNDLGLVSFTSTKPSLKLVKAPR